MARSLLRIIPGILCILLGIILGISRILGINISELSKRDPNHKANARLSLPTLGTGGSSAAKGHWPVELLSTRPRSVGMSEVHDEKLHDLLKQREAELKANREDQPSGLPSVGIEPMCGMPGVGCWRSCKKPSCTVLQFS